MGRAVLALPAAATSVGRDRVQALCCRWVQHRRGRSKAVGSSKWLQGAGLVLTTECASWEGLVAGAQGLTATEGIAGVA